MHAASRHSSDTSKLMASAVDKGKRRDKNCITIYIPPSPQKEIQKSL
jgi:hypothetical protein